ncbi:dihydroneopterin aldolase [Nonlabens tegetincola]|uniref:7,8-dihydroneopterin aldolase n=1 Tax=Nonlabens tegetincola TaxID=323273 RepID=A0A090Q154_9FLAO|nr:MULTISPECIES: dihydroneopterin aldolase [Nonlabens]ALM21079.1 dihydroneopterin aldolase [Nonlabens sp. MIC269]MEE2801381.1 dihydroneopterin aldolase [Bacteroidota bacterium]PQJ20183.1 dihydroneopterin aldolase [Nonlabens tegetincola]GAK95907.1 dihydroneopterin aldolase [Nonlabens tegetincola]
MHKIKLNNVRVFTNHGCLDEEERIGSDYRVDLEISADLTKSAQTDHLKDTVDYVSLNRIIKEEMAIRSKLLEQVAKRILDRIFKEEPLVQQATVQVAKINPPIGGDVESVIIEMSESR